MRSWANRRAHDVGRECLLLVLDKEARQVELVVRGFVRCGIMVLDILGGSSMKLSRTCKSFLY